MNDIEVNVLKNKIHDSSIDGLIESFRRMIDLIKSDNYKICNIDLHLDYFEKPYFHVWCGSIKDKHQWYNGENRVYEKVFVRKSNHRMSDYLIDIKEL